MRTTIRALLAAVVLVGAAACGSDGADDGRSGAASDGSPLSDVTVTLGDQAGNLQTLASAAGVLDDTPYDVEWAEFEGAAPLFQAVQGGAVDTGYAADLPTLQAISGGVPLQAVAAIRNDGSGTAILVQPDSPIRDVRDLAGRQVVVSSAQGSIAEYLLARALEQAGLSYDDVDVQYLLPTDAQAAFASGQIDAWAIFGAYQHGAVENGARTLVTGENGLTSGYGFITATEDALADEGRRAALTDVLDRLAQAFSWAADHPDEYARVIQEENGASEFVAERLSHSSYQELGPPGDEAVAAVQEVADTMHAIGVLDPNVTVADHVDGSLFAN
ncbi:ABC transporter substrate-binding protein [Streptomyces mayteni]